MAIHSWVFHPPQGRISGVLRGFLGQKGRNKMMVFLEVNLGTAESPCLQMGSAGNKYTGVQMSSLQVRESNWVGRNDMDILHSFIICSTNVCWRLGIVLTAVRFGGTVLCSPVKTRNQSVILVTSLLLIPQGNLFTKLHWFNLLSVYWLQHFSSAPLLLP